MGGNPNRYEVAEHIATKVEVNPWMLSTLKKREIHFKHESRGKFRDISGWTYGDFSCLGQEIDRAGLFQFR